MNEIETIIAVSKYDRINNGIARIWTNDIVVINNLNKLGAVKITAYDYHLPLDSFIILPKRKTAKVNQKAYYPEFKILPNDNHNKETLINYTQTERKKKIMHIFSEDDYFIHRCRKYNLPLVGDSFISTDDFRPFGKKAKLTDAERVLRSERMREAKKIGNVKNLTSDKNVV